MLHHVMLASSLIYPRLRHNDCAYDIMSPREFVIIYLIKT